MINTGMSMRRRCAHKRQRNDGNHHDAPSHQLPAGATTVTDGAGIANEAVDPATGMSSHASTPASEFPTCRPPTLATTFEPSGTLAARVGTVKVPSVGH